MHALFPGRHTDGQQKHEKMLSSTGYKANASQSNDEIVTSYLSEGLLSKRHEKQVLEMMRRKRNLRTLLLGMSTGAAITENSMNSMEVSQKINDRTTIWPINPFAGYVPENIWKELSLKIYVPLGLL